MPTHTERVRCNKILLCCSLDLGKKIIFFLPILASETCDYATRTRKIDNNLLVVPMNGMVIVV